MRDEERVRACVSVSRTGRGVMNTSATTTSTTTYNATATAVIMIIVNNFNK